MTIYYFDDDSVHNRWQARKFANDDEAIRWAEGLRTEYQCCYCMLYTDAKEDSTDRYRIVKKWGIDD
jgi:hypothetical protein